MELQEIVIEGKQEEQEVEESRVPSLKLLAAKVYAKKYKKLPGQAVPKECIPYIKLYLPITEDSVYEQYALAREFGDQKRKEEIEKKLIEYNVHMKKFVFLPILDEGHDYKARYVNKKKEKLDVLLTHYIDCSDETVKPEIKALQDHLELTYQKRCIICSRGCLCYIITMVVGGAIAFIITLHNE